MGFGLDQDFIRFCIVCYRAAQALFSRPLGDLSPVVFIAVGYFFWIWRLNGWRPWAGERTCLFINSGEEEPPGEESVTRVSFPKSENRCLKAAIAARAQECGQICRGICQKPTNPETKTIQARKRSVNQPPMNGRFFVDRSAFIPYLRNEI